MHIHTSAGSFHAERLMDGVDEVFFYSNHVALGRRRAGYITGGNKTWLAETTQRTVGYFKTKKAALNAITTAPEVQHG